MAKVIMINTKTRTIRVENADKNIDWITVKGTHVPIEKGQSKSSAVQKFVESKRGGNGDEPKKSGTLETVKRANRWWGKQGSNGYVGVFKRELHDFQKELKGLEGKSPNDPKVLEAMKRAKRAEKYWKDTSKKEGGYGMTGLMHSEWENIRKGLKKDSKTSAQQPAKSGPDKNADVSDIIKDYKKKMDELGPRASTRKTDRVEADAIKEFMTRKLGADRPYEDYYQYWLNGMDKKTADEFNEIYNESEAREMAFSELASDVDHSGLARGEPTYDELMQWSEKQKAKKAQQQPAKASSEKTKEIDAKIKDKKRELENIMKSLTENVETGYFDIAQEMMTDVEYVKGELQQLLDERAKLQ